MNYNEHSSIKYTKHCAGRGALTVMHWGGNYWGDKVRDLCSVGIRQK